MLVDGIDVLERDQVPDQEITSCTIVVDFLRTFCDENEIGDLREYVHFRYLLIHPLKCIMPPHPRERHIFFNIPPQQENQTPEAAARKGKAHVKEIEGLQVRGLQVSQAAEDGFGASTGDLDDRVLHMLSAQRFVHTMCWEKTTKDMHKPFVKIVTDWEEAKAYYAKKWHKKETPTIDYPLRVSRGELKSPTVKMWSPRYAVTSKKVYDKKLNTPDNRRSLLISAILIRHETFDPRIAAHEDRKIGTEVLNQADTQELLKDLVTHSEFARLMRIRAGGLIIHGNDPAYSIAQPERTTALSAFLSYHDTSLARALDISATYAAGLCSKFRPDGDKILQGPRGCLRALLLQLYSHKSIRTLLSIPFLTNEKQLKALSTDWMMEPLLLQLRDLIMDIAIGVSQQKEPEQVRIAAMIDGIDWLEHGPEPDHFTSMVSFFRTLCDEIEFTDLGKFVSFTYILMHPKLSLLPQTPHPLERNLFLNGRLEPLTLTLTMPSPPPQDGGVGGAGDRGKGKAPARGVLYGGPNVQSRPPPGRLSYGQRGNAPKEGKVPKDNDIPEEEDASAKTADPGDRKTGRNGKSMTPQKKVPIAKSGQLTSQVHSAQTRPTSHVPGNSQGSAPGRNGKGKAPAGEATAIETGTQTSGAPGTGDKPPELWEAAEDQARNMVQAWKTSRRNVSYPSKTVQELEVAWVALLKTQQVKKEHYLERSPKIKTIKQGRPITSPGSSKWKTLPMWSKWNPTPDKRSYKPEMDTSRKRNRVLTTALNLDVEPFPRQVAYEDRQHYERHLEANNDRLGQLRNHQDVIRFRKLQTGGLIVHGDDPKYHKKNVTSAVFDLMTIYSRWVSENPADLAITYAAGRNWRGNPNVHGSDGLMRSLCTQLVRHPVFKNEPPNLTFLTGTPDCDAVKDAVDGSLFMLFRDIICEIAGRILKDSLGPTKITAIVDGIDFLEDLNAKPFGNIVSFLRAMCREVQLGQLGEFVHFQYVCIHPFISTLAADPRLTERHVFLR